jgi:MobA-like NTP transferase protein
VRNQDYQQGMALSLRTGLAGLDPQAKAALIVLADQPFVEPGTINQLIACHQESKPQIVIPPFNGFRGNPILLDRSVFAELQSLTGDIGCRAIFGNHTENIRKLAVNDIGILLDIERQEEYKKFTKEEQATTAFRASRTPLESRADLPADRPELIIAGRDATAQMLAKLGKMLDFTVTIVDPLIALAEWAETDRILRVLDFSLLPAAQERYVVVPARVV